MASARISGRITDSRISVNPSAKIANCSSFSVSYPILAEPLKTFSDAVKPLIHSMPKENRKRGRREEKKRKYEDEESASASKRRKSQVVDEEIREGVPYAGPGEIPFYGFLDEDEQEYFKRADSMLGLNQFADPDERALFLANVYKEASGKELKIANSQSCSRLMERLILLSTPSQLKMLFRKFNGQ